MALQENTVLECAAQPGGRWCGHLEDKLNIYSRYRVDTHTNQDCIKSAPMRAYKGLKSLSTEVWKLPMSVSN